MFTSLYNSYLRLFQKADDFFNRKGRNILAIKITIPHPLRFLCALCGKKNTFKTAYFCP